MKTKSRHFSEEIQEKLKKIAFEAREAERMLRAAKQEKNSQVDNKIIEE